MNPLVFVRLKVGMGHGEVSRTVHLTESGPTGHPVVGPNGIRALCGCYLQPGTYDELSGLAGMPCEMCAINSPTPESPRQLVG